MAEGKYRLFVGVDWATEEHQVCALDPDGKILGERSFAHSGDGLAAMVTWLDGLSERCLGSVAVAIEVPHGAVVETLLERGSQVFAINPKQLDRFRDRFSLPGAKDDRRDAYVLADSLRTDAHCFRHLKVEEPVVIQLREWSRMLDELQEERTRAGNRLREQLRRYYPEYIDLAPDVCETWFLAMWRCIPTPDAARRATTRVVERILRQHRIRRLSASQVLQTLRAKPVSVAPGTIEAATGHIRLVADRLRVVNEQIRGCERRLDALLTELGAPIRHDEEGLEEREQRDPVILRSMPGVGRIVAATLLAEAADAVRHRDYSTLRALAGTAPITIRSGKSRRVIMRQACHPRLRHACYHWARVAMQRDPCCRAMYRSMRERGKTHGRSLRSVADRLLRVACAMLRQGTLYDPARATHSVGASAPV
ncbi:MAG: IS110 family transposase [Armatimonadetes bacterium]|nr:IS110 family transposase [Armatimonadota bacterium]